METVVPGALQRLRAADIVRMAGLTVASQGQEYCRSGVVHHTQRQGACLSGIVEFPHSSGAVPGVETVTSMPTHRYPVEVALQSSTSWVRSCSCDAPISLLCVHAAALLYQWLAHPEVFALSDMAPSSLQATFAAPSLRAAPVQSERDEGAKSTRPFALARPELVQRGSAPVSRMMDILTQMGLNELRGLAREYEITTNGMSKQRLAETLLEAMSQPETVRRVASSLEKPQRQLLAALTLAGGSMADEDARGLFERFSLGQPGQFQSAIAALQSKALLFRTALNSTSQLRSGLSGTLDIGWYVPHEVRTALRVTVPVTPFDHEGHAEATIQAVEPYSLLADLLLVARALDGHQLTSQDEWYEHGSAGSSRSTDVGFPRPSSALLLAGQSKAEKGLSGDGSVPLPPPVDLPAPSLITSLQGVMPRSEAFLRFALQLLRLADILHTDDSGTAYLRILSNASQLLLGPARVDALRDLFELWLTQSSYEDLFALREDGVRLRCRATALHVPALRVGELDTENGEARQSLVALLALAPLNQWVHFSAFARFVYRLNPLFLQKRQRLYSSPHWWLEREEGRPLRPLQLSDWLQGEFHYLARLLSGPLHWWGICDIATTREGRLLAFRLTPLAALFFSKQSSNEEEDNPAQNYQALADTLEIVSNEEVLVACSSRAWPIIELLETFTESVGVRASRLCYRFTPKALGEALSRGHRPTALLEFLQQVGTDVSRSRASSQRPDTAPPALIAQLERWVASYGRVRIYTGVTLLETADTLVMRELAATTSLEKEIVQTIQPTLLILKKSGAEAIIDDLKRRGQTPLLHDEDVYGAE